MLRRWKIPVRFEQPRRRRTSGSGSRCSKLDGGEILLPPGSLEYNFKAEIPGLMTDLSIQLQKQGIVLLRDVFRTDSLNRLKAAAERFFQATGPERSLPEQYRYNRFSNSVLLTALVDFGCGSREELLAPLSAPGLGQLISEAMGAAWTCNMEQSWVRKKLALRPACAFRLPSPRLASGRGVRGKLSSRAGAGRPDDGITDMLDSVEPLRR